MLGLIDALLHQSGARAVTFLISVFTGRLVGTLSGAIMSLWEELLRDKP